MHIITIQRSSKHNQLYLQANLWVNEFFPWAEPEETYFV